MQKQVDIKVKTLVDSSDLDALKKKISNSSENVKVGVDTDAKSSFDKLSEVQKKAKEIAAEKTLVNIRVATKGLQEIEKIKSEYKALKNMVPPNFRVKMDKEVEDRINEIRKKINDLDGLSPQIKTMIDSGAIDELQSIQTATDNLDGQSPKIKPTVDSDEALTELQNIQNQAEGIGGLEQSIGGLLGTVGASQLLGTGLETATNMDKAWRSWVGSLQHSGMELNTAKKKADGFYDTINNLASVGQSNDSFFKNIGGLMISQNNNVSKDMLKMTEGVVAGYEMMRGKSGDTLYEMEREMQNFLTTGETGRLTELESVGGGKWMPLLKAAKTAEERMKVLHDMLNEEGYMAALNIDAPSKSIDQLKALFDAGMTEIGTTLINLIKPIADGFLWLDKVTNGLSTSTLSYLVAIGLLGVGFIGLVSTIGMVGRSFTSTISGIKSFSSAVKGGSSIFGALGKGASLATQTAELGANTAALTANTTALEANNLARATSAGAGGAAKGLTQIGTVGAAAGTAAPGAAAGATGFAAISASITSMMVPLLAISAVIAIMIPIIAGLVIEVLLFVRLIGEVVKVLGFDKLNLKPAIGGIKQIGLAIWELGRAFAALTFVNMIGIVYTATGGIITTTFALAQFWLASKEIGVVLNEITKMKIDNSSVTKINMLSSVLVGVSNAMKNMAKTNVAGLITLFTGGVDGIKANIRNIEEIGKCIQEMNIPEVDSSKVDFITKLSDVVKKLSEASQAVNNATGWFKTSVLNTDDVTGMEATLRNLSKIADNINDTQITEVNEDKVGLVKALSEVIKPIAEAAKAVDGANGMFQTSALNEDDREAMQATLRNLSKIAENINNANIPVVDKAKIDSVTNIKNVIMPIVESAKAINDNWQSITVTPAMAGPFSRAIETLYSINQQLNSTAFSIDAAKIQAISNMKTVIKGIGEIGLFLSNNSGNIGSNITDNTGGLSDSITSLYSINQQLNSTAFSLAPEKVTAINNLKPLIKGIGEIGLNLSQNESNLSAIDKNKDNLSKAITALYSINQQLNSTAFSIDAAKVAAVGSLKTLIQNIVSTLSSASGVQPAAVNIGAKIIAGFKSGIAGLGGAGNEALNAVINAVKNRYGAMQSAGNALGAALVTGFKAGAGIHSPMAEIVSGLDATINHIRGLTSQFYTAGSNLGAQLVAGYSDEEKEKLNASQLLNANTGSVMDIFHDTGISWNGGSATGGGDYDITYPSSTNYNFYLESLVTDQNAIDKIGNLINKFNNQDKMRT